MIFARVKKTRKVDWYSTILAADREKDIGKNLCNAFKELLGLDVDLLAALDSKNLFETPSICRNSVECFIWPNIGVIEHRFKAQTTKLLGFLDSALLRDGKVH